MNSGNYYESQFSATGSHDFSHFIRVKDKLVYRQAHPQTIRTPDTALPDEITQSRKMFKWRKWAFQRNIRLRLRQRPPKSWQLLGRYSLVAFDAKSRAFENYGGQK
jgi:hypothetical protein